MNYDLLGEIIFMNDAAFTNINIKKAKVLLCVCKMAWNNKNILQSIDKETARKYCKEIKMLSLKKAKETIYNWDEDDMGREPDLVIDGNYRAKVNDIIISISGESEYVAETIKKIIYVEQKRRIDKIVQSLKDILTIAENLGVDMDNITDDDRYMCLDDYHYVKEQNYRIKVITILKYNAYFINTMFNNDITDETIINYINSKKYKAYYYKTPIIFTSEL